MSSNVLDIGWPKKIGQLEYIGGPEWSSLVYYGENVYGLRRAVVRVDWIEGPGGFEIEYEGELPSGQYVSAYAKRKTADGVVDLIRAWVSGRKLGQIGHRRTDARWSGKRNNPRKISVEAADALMKGYKYKNSNTEVKEGADWQSSRTGLYTLVLHGTEIAWHDLDAGDLLVHDGDYPGTVTKERLNALPNVQVHHSKKQLYLNGKKWNGDTVLVIKDGIPTFPYRKV